MGFHEGRMLRIHFLDLSIKVDVGHEWDVLRESE